MKFQDLLQFTSADVEEAMTRNDPEELQLVPVTVALVSVELKAAEAICIRLCSHQDQRVRGNAIISLGYLARRFGALHEASVKPIIESALLDNDESVRSSAKSAADEIHQFLHWAIAGHVYG